MGYGSFLGYALGTAGLVVLGLLPTRQPIPLVGVAFNLVFAAVMTGAVFTEDQYRQDGSSRWANRGVGAHVLYVVVVLMAIAVAAILAVIARRNSKIAITRPLLVLNGLGNLAAGFVVLVAFDSNLKPGHVTGQEASGGSLTRIARRVDRRG